MSGPKIRLGLIGDNIIASRAPALHEIAGRLCGLLVTYDLLQPTELGRSFEKVLSRCQASGYRGVNITYPYKERVIGHLRIDEAEVGVLGACNTVLFAAAEMLGCNTDYSGFIAAYRNRFGDAAPGRVALVGSGGVGRAIGFALLRLGASKLILFDTDRRKSNALAEAILSVRTQTGVEIADTIEEAAIGTDALVNATPLGMAGIGGCPIPHNLIRGQSWAFDAVYTPMSTPFMLAASAAGLATMSGYELFLYQGIDAFRHFTGHDVAEDQLRAELESLADETRHEGLG